MKRELLFILLVIPLVSAGFDIDINLEKTRVSVDDSLNANITIIDDNQRTIPINIEFLVEDPSKNIIIKDTRVLILKEKENILKNIYLSPSIETGDYLFILNIDYENESATKSKSFNIYEKKILKIERYINYIIFGIILIGIIALLIFVIRQRFRLKNVHKTLNSNLDKIKRNHIKTKKDEKTRKRLLKQKSLLEKAYKSKFISKKSFYEGKKRIEKLLTKVKNRKV